MHWLIFYLLSSTEKIHLELPTLYLEANRVDLDQTALKVQSDLGLHCLLRPNCCNISVITAPTRPLPKGALLLLCFLISQPHICCGHPKEPSHETVLLGNQNICLNR